MGTASLPRSLPHRYDRDLVWLDRVSDVRHLVTRLLQSGRRRDLAVAIAALRLLETDPARPDRALALIEARAAWLFPPVPKASRTRRGVARSA